jgi:hypothetical protein
MRNSWRRLARLAASSIAQLAPCPVLGAIYLGLASALIWKAEGGRYLVYTVPNAYYALVVPILKYKLFENCHVMPCSPIPEVAKRHLAPDKIVCISLNDGCRIGCCETRHIAIGIEPVKFPNQKPKRAIMVSRKGQK